MTAALLDRASVRLPENRPTRRPSGPKLRVLDQAATRRRARHRSALLILFIAVLAGFFAVAFVHAELVAGQHELDAVRAEISQAEARHAELARTVEEASAPAAIVTRATELGMVRARQPVYLAAAAPLRTIEAGPSLQSPTASPSDADGSIAQVAATDPAVTGDAGSDGQLRGSIGQAGGISAAVRIQNTPTVALGADESPAGTSAAAAATEATEAEPASTPAVVTTAPPAGPSSSIAGTRAVSGPAGAAASTAPVESAASSVAGASTGDQLGDAADTTADTTAGTTAGASASSAAAPSSAAPSSSSSAVGSSDPNPAGGLASAAATTSG